MEPATTIDDVLDLFEKPIVEYVQGLMRRVGMPVGKDSAENIVSNVGIRILKRKLNKKPTVSAKEDYERNYSHDHCWKQGKHPACGQPLSEHKQCCLCDTPYNH